MIRFSCPGCGATYSVDDSKGGKSGKCPKCQAQFQIPMPEPAAEAPPAPPPPPPAADGTVEIAPCPGCQARLSVGAADLGVDVECPYCKTVYKAVAAGATPPKKDGTGSRPAKAGGGDDVFAGMDEGGSKTRRRPAEDEERPSRRRRPAEDDEDEDDRPSRRRRRDEDDEEEERPSRRGRRPADDDEDDRPSRRRRDEDDEEEERPRRRRRRGGSYEPHRGTLILILGILGWVGCGIFTAIPAWVMGAADLRKMDEGSMDPEGRSLTQIGRILGMVSCILTGIVFLLYCVIGIIAAAGGGGR